MRIASIARERRMPESSVRTIVKRQDQIKELASRTSHLSPSTVVRKKIYSCNSRGVSKMYRDFLTLKNYFNFFDPEV